MERILINELQKWKEKSDRKPLILRGARQVGKTWLLKDFGKKSFKDVCYINFEQKEVLGAIFEGTLSPKRIIEQLSVYSGKKILPEETLIIFDEVQEMPRALTSLKYFAEEAPEYAICCAGSLLGVALHEGTSFPVGKVEFLDLYPLSFREFLLANGEEMLLDYILKDGNRDLAAFTEKLTDYLKKYFVIGGMPSAILKWLDTHDFFEVDDVQKQLVAAYENDFSKHAPRQLIEKIRYVWDSIPSQLAKENKKFVYGLVREGARAREYEDSLMWLSDAGEIIRTYNISKPDIPLKAYADLKSFKVFLLDVGLLRCMSGVSPKVILEGSRIFEEFKGALTEQYVCQELQLFRRLQTNYYWTSSSAAEVDFLISDGMEVFPLECKAGLTMNAKSLKVYRQKYMPRLSLRTSLLLYSKNKEEGMVNIPLYMLFALHEELGEA
ncbi:ATP-binding protein [Prevotella merdae]|uniref:ATP-binding protein n=1 Tax=Prevotella merdae TaxID=2079531 RepID=UPI003562D290